MISWPATSATCSRAVDGQEPGLAGTLPEHVQAWAEAVDEDAVAVEQCVGVRLDPDAVEPAQGVGVLEDGRQPLVLETERADIEPHLDRKLNRNRTFQNAYAGRGRVRTPGGRRGQTESARSASLLSTTRSDARMSALPSRTSSSLCSKRVPNVLTTSIESRAAAQKGMRYVPWSTSFWKSPWRNHRPRSTAT